MTLKKVLFLLLVLMNVAFMAAQRSGTVSGSINDREMQEEPLLFANVALKNTLWSTQTNFHGNFEFTGVTPGEYTLVVAYLGYETLEVPLMVKAGETTSIQETLSALTIDSKGVVSPSQGSIMTLETTDDRASEPRD